MEGGMNIPIMRYDADAATDAYAAYIAVLAQLKLDPSLENNAEYMKLVDAAFANFFCAFEVRG